MDIYIALVLTLIFILELFKEFKAADRRLKILNLVTPLLAAIAQGLEKTKGETDE